MYDIQRLYRRLPTLVNLILSISYLMSIKENSYKV